jgi:hypothetical protein
MPFNYKDLTYIRSALQSYEAQLAALQTEDCSEDDFTEAQDDIQYISRLIALTTREIQDWEAKGPSINIVKE